MSPTQLDAIPLIKPRPYDKRSIGRNHFRAFPMTVFQFFKSFFATPTFHAGERVNHVHLGTIDRTDGYVLAQTDKGVLVEWPRTGASFVAPSELSVIG
jgi:hypothetical protein